MLIDLHRTTKQWHTSIKLIDVDVIVMLRGVPGARIGINDFGRIGRMVLRQARSPQRSRRVNDHLYDPARHDNEWGYANRMAELARMVAVSLARRGAGG
jgi:glyceraldehyde-3-phosphate dehydrogenase/erythrose-4-phosphate dehydrogenase